MKRALIDKMKQKKWHDLTANTYDDRCGCFSPWERFYNESIRSEAINRCCSLNSGYVVLEVGCGTGHVLSNSTQKFVNSYFVGLDISKHSIEIARKKISSAQVQFIVADAERLPFVDETFDVVLVVATLHHLPNPNVCVNEIFGVLKLKGYLFTEEPHINFLMPFSFIYKVIQQNKRKEKAPFELGFSFKELTGLFYIKNGANKFVVNTWAFSARYLSGIPPLVKLANKNPTFLRFLILVESIIGKISIMESAGRVIFICAKKEPLQSQLAYSESH